MDIYDTSNEDNYIQAALTGNHVQATSEIIEKLPNGKRKDLFRTLNIIAAIQLQMMTSAREVRSKYEAGEATIEDMIIAVSKVKSPSVKDELSKGLDIKGGTNIDSYISQNAGDKTAHDNELKAYEKKLSELKEEEKKAKESYASRSSSSSTTTTSDSSSSTESTTTLPSSSEGE